MKIETENAIRSILSLDAEVSQPDLERAIVILHGGAQTDNDLVHVLRYKEVMDLLHVHRRTLEYYISRGYLDKVYGRGERALGISRDSFIRFTMHRRIERINPSKRGYPKSKARVEEEIKFAETFVPYNTSRKHR